MSGRGCSRRAARQDQKALKRWDTRQLAADIRRADPQPTKADLQAKTCGDSNCPTCGTTPEPTNILSGRAAGATAGADVAAALASGKGIGVI